MTLLPLPTSSLTFNLTSFNDTMINCIGNATITTISEGGKLELTADSGTLSTDHNIGRAVYTEPFHLWDKTTGEAAHFTTHFTFTIISKAGVPADGFAFFLSPFPADFISNKSGGGSLGLFNGSTTQVVAVEFDTYQNNFDPTDDPSNHMGIDVNSIISATSVPLHGCSLVTANVGHATISYNATNITLSAWLSYPQNQTLANKSWNVFYAIDLRNYLPEQVAIGFSAATGDNKESHTILSWDFNSTGIHMVKKRSIRRSMLQVVINVAVLPCLGLLVFLVIWLYRKTRQSRPELELLSRAPKSFRYEKLVAATRDFDDKEKLGEGGCGAVYKGILTDMNNLHVAIKRFSRGCTKGTEQFEAEVSIISQLRHRNLVQLIGYCNEKGDFLLVYEYMPNKSLDKHLYNEEILLLGSKQRYNIALDLASAVEYLQQGWNQCVVHRDIKSSNLLLDSDLSAKLGDFGIAKIVEHGRSLLTTSHPAGTPGYIAPEYLQTGKASKETDVYSFGVVALELACDRKAVDAKLVEWAWGLYERRSYREAIDSRLIREVDAEKMERLLLVGLWCAHPNSTSRPTIQRALVVLRFEAPLPELLSRQ